MPCNGARLQRDFFNRLIVCSHANVGVDVPETRACLFKPAKNPRPRLVRAQSGARGEAHKVLCTAAEQRQSLLPVAKCFDRIVLGQLVRLVEQHQEGHASYLAIPDNFKIEFTKRMSCIHHQHQSA